MRPLRSSPEFRTRSSLVLSLCVLSSDQKKHVFELLALSSVCHTWRSSAVHIPRLWAEVLDNLMHPSRRDPFHSSWVDLLATRAQRLPISLLIYTSMGRHRDLLPIIREHQQHIGKLRIRACDPVCSDALRLLTEPAPLLTSFFVEDVYGQSAKSLPANIFAKNTPNLQRLELINVALPWISDPFMFSNLKDLRLEYYPSDKDIVTLPCLLDALSAMPELVSLALASCPFIPSGASTSPNFSLCLRHVNHLEMRSVSALVGALFIRSVSLPSLKKLDLRIESDYNDTLRGLFHDVLFCHGDTPLFFRPFTDLVISQDDITTDGIRITASCGSEIETPGSCTEYGHYTASQRMHGLPLLGTPTLLTPKPRAHMSYPTTRRSQTTNTP